MQKTADNEVILAWHFTGKRLRDGRKIPRVGAWLKHEGALALCASGLHASADPYDALKFAPGPILHRVELRGDFDAEADKMVARERRIIASVDMTEQLYYFARMQALSCLLAWAHDPPDAVLDYLMTGDASLRSAAESAAESAAWSAARSAARSAAWSAARSAAYEEIRDAVLAALPEPVAA